jgi:hypothetical protein
MRQLAHIASILFVVCASSGCRTNQANYHILKLDKTYDRAIADPYEWALQQFADGPVSGSEVSDYACLVQSYGLRQAVVNLGADESRELLLRQDSPGRVWAVLVFMPVSGGYRYIGHFPAGRIVLNGDGNEILICEPRGAHVVAVSTYTHDGERFVRHSTEDITVGDGAPEENDRRIASLFPEDEIITWEKVSLHP